MSSIRLFILGALADGGDMHGHQLRQLADKEHVTQWTDVSAGSLYGALKRLAAEGLVEPVRTEQVGGYPMRQVWGITKAGRIALANLRIEGLREIVFRPDPFDLALARLDRHRLEDIPVILETRLAELKNMLATAEMFGRRAEPFLTPTERYVIAHKPARLRAEVAWHEQLLAELPRLLAAETNREDRTDA